MTVKEAIANKKVISKQGLTGRLTPYIRIRANHFEFNEGLNITIVEPPKNYKGGGRCVKFLVENSPIEYYEFWSEFKMNIIDPNPPTKSKTPKTKTPKVWTEKQKDRLGDKGYYAEYYDMPNDTPKNYRLIYIGNGSCKYLFETGIDWNTLSWVAAPTKKKLLLDKENKTDRMTRYIYFKTYDKLIAYIQKNPGIDPRIGMNAPIKEEYLEELKEIRKNKLERITKD